MRSVIGCHSGNTSCDETDTRVRPMSTWMRLKSMDNSIIASPLKIIALQLIAPVAGETSVNVRAHQE